MEFVYPAFFAALAALLIPIFIHLFNLKKFKKVVFPNVRLLQTIEFETKSQSRLKHLLVLLSRLLFIFFLVAAFTLPFLSINEDTLNKKASIISIYVDNSFSMSASASELSFFDTAKDKARTIALNSTASTQFQLITNDFKYQESNLLTREQLLDAIDDLVLSPNFKKINEVAQRQRQLLLDETELSADAYLLSDFQKEMMDLEGFPSDSAVSYIFLPINALEVANVFVDSLWFESPVQQFGEKEVLKVRIQNSGESDLQEIPINLSINNQLKTPGVVDIAANSSVETELSFVNNQFGYQKGKVTIRDYPVTFDDELYFTYKVDSTISVLIINGKDENTALKNNYSQSDFLLNTFSEKAVDYGKFAESDLIVLNELSSPSTGLIQELKRFLGNSGTVLVLPAEDADNSEYNIFLNELGLPSILSTYSGESKVDEINLNSTFFKNVFEQLPRNLNLPEVKKHYVYNRSRTTSKEELLGMNNGQPLLSAYYPEKGTVYLFSVPLQETYSNLGRHSIIVPVLYNIALFSKKPSKLNYTIGKDISIERPNKGGVEALYHLKNEETDIVPETRVSGNQLSLYFHNQVNKAGIYQLISEQDATAEIAFNYDRKESKLQRLNDESLLGALELHGLKNTVIFKDSVTENLASLINFKDKGRPLWKYCIILALVFLSCEMLLSKFWK